MFANNQAEKNGGWLEFPVNTVIECDQCGLLYRNRKNDPIINGTLITTFEWEKLTKVEFDLRVVPQEEMDI